MCNNGFAQDYYGLSSLLGREKANLLYRAFDAGVDKVRSIVREEGIDCHFKRVGKLKLAAKPAHYDRIARSQELLAREVDPETSMVPRSEMHAEIGSDRYFGGMLFLKSASMHMGQYGQGMAQAAVRHGAIIHENNPVTAIRRVEGQVHEVSTPMVRFARVRCCWPPARRRSARWAGSGAGSCRWAPMSSPPSHCLWNCWTN
jgi:glycine/D-amino acid oxidase-like deaminating enzyme